MRPLMFLLKLAWDCRYRLPLLITTRRVPRPRPPPPPRMMDDNVHDDENIRDDTSDDSWSTVDEDYVSETDVTEDF
ncbi:hypothetical protein JTB14_014440 [Gonioctena quinquepunctata]|nr:hypothetical protein JTB14_014440 [Gonioctena quinquepunctata]